MKCKLCGSKYVEMREPRHELGRIVYIYYCHSCKKSYEEEAASNAGSLKWLMTFDNDQTYMKSVRAQAEFNMNSEGKLVVNQLYEGKHSTASCSPKMHVKKDHYGNKFHMEYDSFRSMNDVTGVLFTVKKIEMNPQLTAEALKNEAMKALHRKDNLFVIGDQYSTALLNDAVAWLATALGGGPQKKKGCYVATCVYGSYDCPEVWTLRRFRDDTLAATWYGRAFIRLYYAVSPMAVKLFGETKWFRGFWKKHLDKMVAKLQSNGVESTFYNDRQW